MEKVKKEELEVPEDLKETPRQRRLDGRVILIGSIFLALVIFGAIAYFSRTKSVKYTPTVLTASPLPTPAPFDASGWKTYVSSEGGLIFKYPSDWKINIENNDPGDLLADEVSITPPNNKDGFVLSYDVYDITKEVGGPFHCDNCKYTVINQINPEDEVLAYTIINTHAYTYKLKIPEYDQELSVSKFKDNSKNDQGWPYINSPKNQNLLVRWAGKYYGTRFGATGTCGGAGCAVVSIDLKDFETKKEVKVAEQIISTFRFDDLTASKFTNSTVDTSTWKTYSGKYISFKYPPEWTPIDQTPINGGDLEDVKLGIPGNPPDQDIGFSSVQVENLQINDGINTPISISGKNGHKWVRKGEGFVAYDYIVGNFHITNPPRDDSFGINVTVGKEDPFLESQLDTLVKTVSVNLK